MDPLSHLLRLLDVRSYGTAVLDAGGEWAIQVLHHHGMKFFVVVKGACSVWVDDNQLHEVKTNECFVATQGRPFFLANSPTASAQSSDGFVPPVFDGRLVTLNQGGDFLAVGGYFSLGLGQTDLLLEALPPIVRFSEGPDRNAMVFCVERLTSEVRAPSLGTDHLAQQLVTMMLVQVLRASIADGTHRHRGWLAALADPRIRVAIDAMHADPQSRWTLQSLAAKSNMSRTAFTLKFKEAMGIAPLDYLTRWRMLLAQDRLAKSNDPTAEIGESIGYESERSFARAFRRLNGCSPREFRLSSRQTKRASPAGGVDLF